MNARPKTTNVLLKLPVENVKTTQAVTPACVAAVSTETVSPALISTNAPLVYTNATIVLLVKTHLGPTSVHATKGSSIKTECAATLMSARILLTPVISMLSV